MASKWAWLCAGLTFRLINIKKKQIHYMGMSGSFFINKKQFLATVFCYSNSFKLLLADLWMRALRT